MNLGWIAGGLLALYLLSSFWRMRRYEGQIDAYLDQHDEEEAEEDLRDE